MDTPTTPPTDCPYEMIPANRTYVVWHCRLEAGHDGWHFPRESQRDIKDTYHSEGKMGHKERAKVNILVAGHEVELDSIVSKTKTGTISKNTTMGKVVSAALEKGWQLKAGQSTYQVDGADPEVLTWAEGVKGTLWFRVTGTDCNWRGWSVTYQELVDAIVNEKEEIPMKPYVAKVREDKGYE